MNWSIWNPAVVLRRSVIEGKSQIDAVVQLEQEGKGKRDMDAMRALLAEIKGAS